MCFDRVYRFAMPILDTSGYSVTLRLLQDHVTLLDQQLKSQFGVIPITSKLLCQLSVFTEELQAVKDQYTTAINEELAGMSRLNRTEEDISQEVSELVGEFQ